MKLSIIIPVYNVEKYLRRCINSILNQKKFKFEKDSIEVLLINDGSPDNCHIIIDEYVDKYDFIKGFYKTNGGLSDARNFGLEQATGDYIWFIDSDDWIDEESLYTLSQELENSEIEVLEFDYSMKYNSEDNKLFLNPYYSKIKTNIISGKELLKLYGYSISVTNKIFKRETLLNNDFSLPKDRLSDDTVPVLKLLLE
ncbi:glycosyltransferase family 2 protein, partial [Algoriella sp.]|uniref:glycosyltransferase family 2 protein n=1 Tax=Algoriella sp. TaxID=1872434 RepID=UPI001B0571DA